MFTKVENKSMRAMKKIRNFVAVNLFTFRFTIITIQFPGIPTEANRINIPDVIIRWSYHLNISCSISKDVEFVLPLVSVSIDDGDVYKRLQMICEYKISFLYRDKTILIIEKYRARRS